MLYNAMMAKKNTEIGSLGVLEVCYKSDNEILTIVASPINFRNRFYTG
jgi:hypothetical protein